MYEYEEQTELIGAHCTLLEPYRGYTEGQIVADYGIQLLRREQRELKSQCHRDGYNCKIV